MDRYSLIHPLFPRSHGSGSRSNLLQFSGEIILSRILTTMNTQLIDSLARIILSLSEEERELLNRKIESEQRENLQINAQILDLETRVKQYENQYRMSSEEFSPRFRSGELGDAIDYFEWNVYYEMLLAARKEISLRSN
nr:unnamed protein product [Microcystis aeruginosa PCC 7806]